MARLWAGLPAAVAAVVLAGCFGGGSLTSNQGEVCSTLERFVVFMEPMLPRTNPEGTIGQANYASTVGLDEVNASREVLNGPQEELLDRYQRALEEYNTFVRTRPAEEPLAATAAALDSYSLNLLLSYEYMLNRIECPLPSIVAGLPRN